MSMEYEPRRVLNSSKRLSERLDQQSDLVQRQLKDALRETLIPSQRYRSLRLPWGEMDIRQHEVSLGRFAQQREHLSAVGKQWPNVMLARRDGTAAWAPIDLDPMPTTE